MTLILDLPPDLERQLAQEAARRGQPVDACARALLEERLGTPASERVGVDEKQSAPHIPEPSDLFEALDMVMKRTDDYDEDFVAPTPSAIAASRALVSA